jgi:hypothetical protein
VSKFEHFLLNDAANAFDRAACNHENTRNVHENMRRIPAETWAGIRTAYASGIGLRELARNMNIPPGTILARSKRDGWSQQIRNAKTLAVCPEAGPITATPMESAALSIHQRGERHVSRMASVTEKVMPHIRRMPPNEILHRVDQVEKLDKIARRTFGLHDQPEVAIGIAMLSNDGSMG